MSDAPILPFSRIIVSEVLSSRYEPGTRPALWEERRPGFEEVRDQHGRRIPLQSEGGQSSPAPDWQLMLLEPVTTDDGKTLFPWTLYGLGGRK